MMTQWQVCLTLILLASFAFAQLSNNFALKVLERKGTIEVQLPDGVKRPAREDEKFSAGSSVITQARSIAILEWLPYKAMVKLAPETEVQLLTTRAFLVKKGRVWIGTPPPAAWERRFPLPVQSGQVHFVSSPDAYFSISVQPDGAVTVSVDQGRVFVSVGQLLTSVSKGNMLVIKPQNIIIGPMLMTKQERIMWDMGGLR